MNFHESEKWLYSKLPMFMRKGKAAVKPGLTNILKLCEALDNPHKNFKSIHIAGTNGKGSTAHMLASVLQESGLSVGLITSPHLISLTERMRLNGKNAPEEFVAEFVTKFSSVIEDLKASYFEALIGMSFYYFAQNQPDIVVIETGLGGRLDSTNIIEPLLSVITNISFDHTDILGDTLEKIAFEKAGIIKAKTPVVIGERVAETEKVFKSVAQERLSPIYFSDELEHSIYPMDLLGDYQIKNQRTVLKSVEILKELGFSISDEIIKNGLKNIRQNTGLRGRYELLQNHPKTIADVAHNPAGIDLVMRQLKKENYTNLHLVLGFVADKKLDEIFPFLPQKANYYLSTPNIPRGLKLDELKDRFPKQLDFKIYVSMEEALQNAQTKAEKDDLIFIGGSTFVVAELIPKFTTEFT